MKLNWQQLPVNLFPMMTMTLLSKNGRSSCDDAVCISIFSCSPEWDFFFFSLLGLTEERRLCRQRVWLRIETWILKTLVFLRDERNLWCRWLVSRAAWPPMKVHYAEFLYLICVCFLLFSSFGVMFLLYLRCVAYLSLILRPHNWLDRPVLICVSINKRIVKLY